MNFDSKFAEILEKCYNELINYDESSLAKLVSSIKSIPDKLIMWNSYNMKIHREKLKKEKLLDETISDVISKYKEKAKSATELQNFAKYELNNNRRIRKLKSDIIDLDSLDRAMQKIGKLAEKKLDLYIQLMKMDSDLIINKHTMDASITKSIYDNLEKLLEDTDASWEE